MTIKLNDNPQDPMFQVHVNLWHSTFSEAHKASNDVEAAIENADKSVKAFKKRFIGPKMPESTAEPVYATQDPYPGNH